MWLNNDVMQEVPHITFKTVKTVKPQGVSDVFLAVIFI